MSATSWFSNTNHDLMRDEIEEKKKELKEIKENLLEPFTKYNYGDHTQISSGLGLFICKELAEKNNAYITYKVDEGKICFMIELPLE